MCKNNKKGAKLHCSFWRQKNPPSLTDANRKNIYKHSVVTKIHAVQSPHYNRKECLQKKTSSELQCGICFSKDFPITVSNVGCKENQIDRLMVHRM